MPPKNKYKAVLFDLGGTLVKTLSPAETFYRILALYGISVSVDKVAEAHRENMKTFDNRALAREGRKYWIKWNAQILKKIGVKENVDLLAGKIDELWWDYADLEVYPEAVDTLNLLKAKGIKLGIVTNGFKTEIDQILHKLGLENYFDVGVGADSCRKAKPDKKIFWYALEKLGVQAEEALFVGDDFEADYAGAIKAGLHALLLD
ncbi:MAG: HAD-IA family hydrolase [Candidatus Bathyarchaeia archaeon]